MLAAAGALALAASACKREAPAAPVVPAERLERPPSGPPPTSVPLSRPDDHCLSALELPASTVQLRKARGSLTLGVLAGLKDASDENVAVLKQLVAELKRRGAEALVVDGDLGDQPEHQELLLGALAQSGLPVLAAAGNREVRTDLDEAEEALRKKGVVLHDLARTRVVDLGDALVVGLPGAFERKQLRTDGTCAYTPRDLEALQLWLTRLPAGAPPVVLVAAVPPRGQDAHALDHSDGQNLGDPRLAALVQSRRAMAGIFAQVWEAGGRAVDLAGRPIAPGTLSDYLFLNPGAADHTPWPMDDGTTSNGQAALLTIQGKKASYEVVRAAPPQQGKL